MSPKNGWLLSILEDVRARTHVPGIAAEVSWNGVRYNAATGCADTRSKRKLNPAAQFEISCLAKMLCGLVVLKSSRAGMVDLDSPIVRYLPELHPLRKVSVRHLLTHTSGYLGLDILDARVKWSQTWPGLVEHLKRSPQLFQPGSVFNYEHSEHVILGEMLRRIVGKSALQLASESILDPLNLAFSSRQDFPDDSEFAIKDHRYNNAKKCFECVRTPAPGSFWASSLSEKMLSLSDIVKIGEALLTGSMIGCSSADLFDDRIVLPAIYRSHGDAERLPVAVGHVLSRYSGGMLGHNGSAAGQSCALRMHVSKAAVIAVGINAWQPWARDEVISGICRALAIDTGNGGTSDFPKSRRVASVAAGFPLRELTGTYLGNLGKEVMVTEEGDNLLKIEIPRLKDGAFHIRKEENGHHSILARRPTNFGFFPDPASGAPCMILGLYSYAKRTIH